MKKHHHHQGESPGIGLCQTQTVTRSRTTKSSSLESTAQVASGCKTKAQAQIPSQTALPVVWSQLVSQEQLERSYPRVSGCGHSANCIIGL